MFGLNFGRPWPKLRHFESQSSFDSRQRHPGVGFIPFSQLPLLTEETFEKRYKIVHALFCTLFFSDRQTGNWVVGGYGFIKEISCSVDRLSLIFLAVLLVEVK